VTTHCRPKHDHYGAKTIFWTFLKKWTFFAITHRQHIIVTYRRQKLPKMRRKNGEKCCDHNFFRSFDLLEHKRDHKARHFWKQIGIFGNILET
jgi:hypothetical protein